MLLLDLGGADYNKAARNRKLQGLLHNRSHGAVEFKHQNISAVLHGIGLPYIDGYKPRGNVQTLLRSVVEVRVRPMLTQLDDHIAAPQEPPVVDDVMAILVRPPGRDLSVREESPHYVVTTAEDKPFSYAEREALNRSLGEAGETLVMAYEQTRLKRAGKDHLAGSVEQVSKTQGDHLGYDIHSYETSGRDRFVEVKTTRYGKLTPFYISGNEIQFAKANRRAYQLYRVFDFRKRPKLFTLPGDVERHVRLNPVNYRASF